MARALLPSLLLGLSLAACDDGDAPPDAGASPADAGSQPDAEAEDSGRVDSGARDGGIRDVGARDAAGYCTVNDQIVVGQERVAVGSASMPARSPTGRSSTDCIDLRITPGTFAVTLYLSGCLDAPGSTAPLGRAELDGLEIALFPEEDSAGAPVDPSVDFTTGRDRRPDQRKNLRATVEPVAAGVCPSGAQYILGLNAPVGDALISETRYVLRTRTASAGADWVTQYHRGIIARNDQVQGGSLDMCTTQRCFFRRTLTLLRRAALVSLAQAAQMPVPGASDLTDGRGTGHALIEANDCVDAPVRYAVAGFSPAPLNGGYLTAAGFDPLAAETDGSGLYLALGFPGLVASSSTSLTVTAAVGLSTGSSCTEEFGGGGITIYPDSVTVFRSGRETVLHAR